MGHIMNAHISRRKFVNLVCISAGLKFVDLLGLNSLTKTAIAAEQKNITPSPDHSDLKRYAETIEVLKAAHFDEIQSYHIYVKYSQKAQEENLPNVAYLFKTFAESEFINARNYFNLLYDLKATIQTEIKPVRVLSTQENLEFAIKLELEEIEEHYPQFLYRIANENHINAIASIQHALSARKQHRDLLNKMKRGTGFFWRVMSKKIESARLKFFLCQICGSIQTEKPQRTCPICENPAYFYKEVERPKLPSGSPEISKKYAKTIEALKTAHVDEIYSYHVYLKYSEKAVEENLPNIAYLFKAYAESAFINARNCYNLLKGLKQEHYVKVKPVTALTTRENLAAAIELELEETEEYYPQFIEDIKKENHYNALAFAQHALDIIENQLEFLLDLQSGSGSHGDLLFANSEDSEFTLFICQICGSAQTKIPERACPVCENPAHFYKEVDKPV